MLDARRRARRAARRRRPGRLPDLDRAPRAGAGARSPRRGPAGIFHVAGAGRCSWFELARAAIERAGLRCAVLPGDERRVPAAGAAAGLQRARQRARRRCAHAAAAGRTGSTRSSPRERPRRRSRHEAAGLRRRRLHRLELRAPARERAGRRARRARQAHLRGAPREPRGRRPHAFVHGAIEDPEAVASAIEGVEAVVNFAAETHVDRSIAEPDAFVKTHAVGHLRAARGGAPARDPLPAGVDRRGLRLDRGRARSPSRARSSPRRPTARRRRAPTCSCSPTRAPTAWRP